MYELSVHFGGGCTQPSSRVTWETSSLQSSRRCIRLCDAESRMALVRFSKLGITFCRICYFLTTYNIFYIFLLFCKHVYSNGRCCGDGEPSLDESESESCTAASPYQTTRNVSSNRQLYRLQPGRRLVPAPFYSLHYQH
jgi:hypothetical protein